MKKIVSVFCLSLLILSCKKNQLGGTSTIKGTVLHHSNFIAGARVFIKFNAKEFPGGDTTKYDSKVTADAEGNFAIECYKGDYYLYGYGYDPRIKEIVTGGVPVRIRKNETREIDVSVTE